jgi:hypothetical protein
MKKAIISQPMRGKTETQIRSEREAAILYLAGKGYEVVDSVFTDFPANLRGNAPLKSLARAIDLIADVDLVYFMKGWDSARDCIIEHACCREYGIDIVYEPASTFGPFDFSVALRHVKQGMKIYREAWNGQGQFVYIQSASMLEKGMARNEVLAEYLEAVGKAKINAHLDMKNAQGEIIIGWAATQTDMLAEDWYAF